MHFFLKWLKWRFHVKWYSNHLPYGILASVLCMYVCFTITIHNRSFISMKYCLNLNDHLFSIKPKHNNNLLHPWWLGRIPTTNSITFYFILGEYCYHIQYYSLRPCILVLRCIVWLFIQTNSALIPKNLYSWIALYDISYKTIW